MTETINSLRKWFLRLETKKTKRSFSHRLEHNDARLETSFWSVLASIENVMKTILPENWLQSGAFSLRSLFPTSCISMQTEIISDFNLNALHFQNEKWKNGPISTENTLKPFLPSKRSRPLLAIKMQVWRHWCIDALMHWCIGSTLLIAHSHIYTYIYLWFSYHDR